MRSRILHKVLSFCVALTLIFTVFTITVYTQDDISVTLNGETLNFDVSPQLINNRTMVPMRVIFEALGAAVDWNGDTQTVTAVKDDIVITMQVDNDCMTVGGYAVMLDSPPIVIDNRTLVPVRAVSEAMWADVKWIGFARVVEITTRAELAITLANSKTVSLGQFVDKLDEPDRKEFSIGDHEWYVYNSDPKNFVMVCVDNNRVQGFYTNAKGFVLSNGVRYGDIDESGKRDVDEKTYVLIYTDPGDGNRTYAVLVAPYQPGSDANTLRDGSVEIQSRIFFDIVNTFRVNHGEDVLIWDGIAAEVAQDYSRNCAEADNSKYVIPDGKTLGELYSVASGRWCWGWDAFGGALGGASRLTIGTQILETFNWQISLSRKSILNEFMKYAGVGGVYGRKSSMYGGGEFLYITCLYVTY